MKKSKMHNQEYTSKKSCIRQLPAGFNIIDKYFGWQSNTKNLDIGGGKYDIMTDKLLEKNVTNLVYDPYNRLEQKTMKVASEVGFNLVGTIQLALSNINLKVKNNKFKYEPIFIFRKK